MPEQDCVSGATAHMSPLPIVAIGASAGGIPALQRLLGRLPANLGAAIVVAIHLDPVRESELSSVLATSATMPVHQVKQRMLLEANTVFVIAPNTSLVIGGGEVHPEPPTSVHSHRLPIDILFRSLAGQDCDGYAVILTGSGSDGALGCSAVRAAGGLVFAQDPAEAEYPSMPQAAISVGVDFVLPIDQIAQHLIDLVQKSKGAVLGAGTLEEDEDRLTQIFAEVRAKSGQDFSKYKRATVMRRLIRRMQLAQVDGLASYLEYLRRHDGEVQALFCDLLISVTCFFRDHSVFSALTGQVIPKLFERDGLEPIRVWVPGCATGEEAYSIAILLLEEAERRQDRRRLQIFASDLDAKALVIAREGTYSAAIARDVGETRLKRFFVSDGESYRIRQDVRDIIVFAPHNLLRDPPCSHCDLISCRNVLIYLQRDLQDQAIATFNYALRDGGYLLLGTSEIADNPAGLFTLIDTASRIYQVHEMSRVKRPPLMHDLAPPVLPPGTARSRSPPLGASVGLGLHLEALEARAPPSMLINDKHLIMNLSAGAGRYLIHPGGPVTSDAVANVRPELTVDLSAALHRAFEHSEKTLTRRIAVRFDDHAESVVLLVQPRGSVDAPKSALVLFMEGGPADEERLLASGSADQSVEVKQLREELFATRTLLRTSREQYEAASEQLRSANEELQSINEEYRSTAEELVTSKEELQSINSELQSLNHELKLKYDQEQRAHNDLRNLMGATDIATLFLDRDMRIKRFTPRTTEIFSVHDSDVGRPISDFTHRLENIDLVAEARHVLEDLASIEKNLHSVDGRWFTTRFRPYRTIDDKIEGVVITFFDVTERREADAAWAQRQRLLLGELSHRVKNTLAVVQAVVRQSLKSSGASPEAVTVLLNRLRALASSHDLLVANEWKGAGIEALALTQLRPYVEAGQLFMTGEPIMLPPPLATPLGLTLHELATNAIKYGALSKDTGRVELVWTMHNGTGAAYIDLTWKESGGPVINGPIVPGTGMTLIRHSISGAQIHFDYEPLGLCCKISIPLSTNDGTLTTAE